jgi:3'-phosphoadenosine 5'-phosphosulfate sulfotransferase (PAPS reductase)/FAD synthetase
MLDLCYQMGWRGPLLYQTYGELETLSDNLKMANWARDYYDLNLYIKNAPGEFEIYRQIGHFFIEAITHEEKKAVRQWYRKAFGELSKFVKKQGWMGQFLGLRIEESNQRRKMLGHRSGLYFANNRKMWTCCPIYCWSGQDVWAYLVTQNLPWAALYDAPGQSRERIRNDIVFLAGSGSIRHGQFCFWKKLYPELFNLLAKEWPEIRNYI